MGYSREFMVKTKKKIMDFIIEKDEVDSQTIAKHIKLPYPKTMYLIKSLLQDGHIDREKMDGVGNTYLYRFVSHYDEPVEIAPIDWTTIYSCFFNMVKK
jgi:predicted transcriptional regulator